VAVRNSPMPHIGFRISCRGAVLCRIWRSAISPERRVNVTDCCARGIERRLMHYRDARHREILLCKLPVPLVAVLEHRRAAASSSPSGARSTISSKRVVLNPR